MQKRHHTLLLQRLYPVLTFLVGQILTFAALLILHAAGDIIISPSNFVTALVSAGLLSWIINSVAYFLVPMLFRHTFEPLDLGDAFFYSGLIALLSVAWLLPFSPAAQAEQITIVSSPQGTALYNIILANWIVLALTDLFYRRYRYI